MWQQRSACRRIVLRYERRRELADDPIIDIETSSWASCTRSNWPTARNARGAPWVNHVAEVIGEGPRAAHGLATNGRAACQLEWRREAPEGKRRAATRAAQSPPRSARRRRRLDRAAVEAALGRWAEGGLGRGQVRQGRPDDAARYGSCYGSSRELCVPAPRRASQRWPRAWRQNRRRVVEC